MKKAGLWRVFNIWKYLPVDMFWKQSKLVSLTKSKKEKLIVVCNLKEGVWHLKKEKLKVQEQCLSFLF